MDLLNEHAKEKHGKRLTAIALRTDKLYGFGIYTYIFTSHPRSLQSYRIVQKVSLSLSNKIPEFFQKDTRQFP